MSKIASALAAVAIALAGALQSERAGAVTSATSSMDYQVLRAASKMLAHRTRPSVVMWLRRQRVIRRSSIASDGKTIDLQFKDRLQSVIFAAAPRSPHPGAHLQSFVHDVREVAPSDGSRRALVLEPFASELNLGPHAGDFIVEDLRAAGFEVDHAYDEQVTVISMQDLWKYDVVYVNTHSGVNQYGEGVVGTGQLAGDDPSVKPYIADGSVIVGGVAGTNRLYYGILSNFIIKHEQHFNPGAFMVINGCTLLLGSAFWKALEYQGVGALVSWYDDVAPPSASVAATLVFDDLVRHRTIAEAVSHAPLQGIPFLNAEGGTAHLGYVGDGSLTLWPAAAAPSATPTPTWTVTLTPTDLPTATATRVPRDTPTATSTWTCTHGRYRSSNLCH